ncbi:MAG: hypothetical protein HUJ61_02935 [Bacilli bacterium]|nr:hypothetical protein [Bacilli bacterium]
MNDEQPKENQVETLTKEDLLNFAKDLKESLKKELQPKEEVKPLESGEITPKEDNDITDEIMKSRDEEYLER